MGRPAGSSLASVTEGTVEEKKLERGRHAHPPWGPEGPARTSPQQAHSPSAPRALSKARRKLLKVSRGLRSPTGLGYQAHALGRGQIGRASCRERV